MNILLLLPSSRLSYDILSKALFFKKHGYNPTFLSTSPRGDMHIACDKYNITAHSLNISSLNYKTYLYTGYLLVRFVKKEKIDLIFSNNLQGNFVAVLAEFIHRKRTILVRHHSDYIYTGNNKNAKRQQLFVNRFGSEFIAISNRVKKQMIKERTNPEKIHRVNLGFDFSLFPKPNSNIVNELKGNYLDSYKLCVIARLIPLKRHELLFEAVRILLDSKIKIILWVVGDGPLTRKLRERVIFYRMEKVILFTGYINDPGNYLSASDLLVHISESEASSHVIREAALVETPVLICRDVGDFEDYIIDKINGFYVDKNINAKNLSEKIIELSLKIGSLNQSAIALKKTVINHFDINKAGKNFLAAINQDN